jgi:type IV pilus assembly protein PilN
MPKINLLAEGKRPVVARKSRTALPSAGPAELGNYLLFGFLVVGILVAVGWWLLLSNRISNKAEEIAAAQAEVKELEAVIKEVEQYKAKKDELERKIAVINELKDNQRGPVQIMDEVSKAVPELLWLANMDVTNTNITMRGSAFNTSAIANLIDNLDRVEAFQEPVLQDTTQRAGQRGAAARSEVYDFRLTFPYSFKKPAPATGEGAAPAGGASPAGPGAAR